MDGHEGQAEHRTHRALGIPGLYAKGSLGRKLHMACVGDVQKPSSNRMW